MFACDCDLIIALAGGCALFMFACCRGCLRCVLPLQEICPVGCYCDTYGNLLTCPSGTYQNQTGASMYSQCLPCPLGSSAPYGSNAACTLCPAGSYASSSSSLSCTYCPGGTYGTAVGATSNAACIACPLGTFCPSGGATLVRVCARIRASVSVT